MKENFEKAKEVPELESAELSLKTNRGLYEYKILLRITDEDLRGKTILDLGSGQQQKFATEVRERLDARVFSLDVDLKDPGKKPAGVIGLFSKLPFVDGSFDLVVSVAAMPLYLHSKSEMENAFQEVVRVLRRGGKAILGPVAYTEVVSRDKNKGMAETHRKYSYPETKEVLEEVLGNIQGISFKFLPEVYHEPRHPVSGRPRREPPVLTLSKS